MYLQTEKRTNSFILKYLLFASLAQLRFATSAKSRKKILGPPWPNPGSATEEIDKYSWKNLDLLDSKQFDNQVQYNIHHISMSWQILGRKGCIHYCKCRTSMCPVLHLSLKSFMFVLTISSTDLRDAEMKSSCCWTSKQFLFVSKKINCAEKIWIFKIFIFNSYPII